MFPSHPSNGDTVGQKPCVVSRPQIHLHKHCMRAPSLPPAGWEGGGGGSGKYGREEIFPPSSHNEPIVGGAGGGIGERDRPRRQTHEAAGGDAKGSRYREFCACDLQLQCLKSPNCDGEKIMWGCSQKPKPHKRRHKEIGECRRLLCAQRCKGSQNASQLLPCWIAKPKFKGK